MKTNKFISDFKGRRKQDIIASLQRIEQNRKKQIVIFEDALIKPLRDMNRLSELVRKGQYPIDKYMSQQKKLHEHIKGLVKIK